MYSMKVSNVKKKTQPPKQAQATMLENLAGKVVAPPCHLLLKMIRQATQVFSVL